MEMDDAGQAGVNNLRDILNLLEGTSVIPRIRIAPSLARGLSYYTGAIMEIAVPDLAGSLEDRRLDPPPLERERRRQPADAPAGDQDPAARGHAGAR